MPVKHRYIDCRYGQLHLNIAAPEEVPSTEKVPLVCLHMSPYSGAYYRLFQEEMARDRMVICPDTPGYGGSGAPASLPSIEDYAAAMSDMLDVLGHDQVDVLGFHTGSFIAAELALLEPKRVRKLIVPGLPFMPPARRAELRQQYNITRPYFEQDDYIQKRWNIGLSGRGGQSDERFLELFAESLRPGAEKANWGFVAVFGYEPEKRLPKIEQPTFIPVPDEALAKNSREAAELFQNAQLEEWSDLKGDLFDVHAAEVCNRLRPFLDK